LEYFDTKALFFHHLLTSVIVQVICAFRVVSGQTSVESRRRQKVSFYIREDNFAAFSQWIALGQPSDTLCFIFTVAAAGTTAESLSRVRMDCAQKMCLCLLKKTL
jgi:hypothetical protein